MIIKYVLPILAVAGLVFAINRVVEARRPGPTAEPIVEPPTRPTSVKMIAGSGLVEARRENIPIGVNIPGVVTEVFVKKGEKVKVGAPLFRTDDREFNSMLAVREAELASSQAQLHKLIASPRPEDIPPAKAAAQEAEARMADAEAALARTERLFQRQMIAASDYDKDRYAYYAAKATYAKAKADLEKILAGSWKEDIEIARAAVQLAQSQVQSIKTSLERLIVRAPMDGEVLQLNVRLGQFAAMTWKEPMIVLGDSKRLHVRIDIDEPELLYFSKGAEAIATLKGRPNIRFPLKFVYVEPYVIPKQSLTGNNSERVDQRVLQVIYELPDDRPLDVYIGQQVDVYMKAATISKSIDSDMGLGNGRLPFEEETPSSQRGKPDA
ncbi:MAG TPA: efflux RND transporter periplasmic adaptor subunit [Isosphaeraceae bacterium]|nr:efflux RND transporter periplasmic adaptor subunit [Isosphaeraceae bacterium]